jgi:sulfite exporter TauE/SafE
MTSFIKGLSAKPISGNRLDGTLLILAFGAATLPSMLFASPLFGKLGPRLRGGLQKLAALFVIALGVATLWQGLRFYLVMYRLVL